MAFELRDHADSSGRRDPAFISYIADQSRELSNIVDDLLVAARSDDTLTVRPEVVDLHGEVVEMLASNPGDTQPEIVIGGPVLAWADPLRLRQIVRNLLTNARRYGGPKVTIEAGHESRGIFLRVRDDGAGVPTRSQVLSLTPVGGDAVAGSIGLAFRRRGVGPAHGRRSTYAMRAAAYSN
jgi:signal transduction histidine kinase